MKASFPPFASCFPPWSCCARPALICDQRATGAWLGALVVRICLRVLDRTAKQHENRTTIKAFSQTGEGVERIARRMMGNVTDYMCWRVCPPKGFSLRRGSAVGGGEARNPPLWQIQADAAPMRQRVLQASASQNDYAEL